MKKSLLVIALTTFAFGSILTSCNSSSEKVEDAKEDVSDAKEDLDEAEEEYLEDLEDYRKETNERIESNNEAIADLKILIEKEKAVEKAKHQKQIAELELKNSEMKKKMAQYRASGKENWENFKSEFKRDMDELGAALKDLTVNNVK